ncbi:MAG: TetR/AcrR family transcriptional regulator [Rhodospirillaceae bacterium]|nr:TetR/AcrR family transcriptional regulator [Rhodospirillaceae bacterium]
MSEATPLTSADARSGKPKLRKSDRTRIRIIEAFERLLLTRGIEASNITAIAEEAGIAKPLIYRYFGGFAGLVQACAERHRLWSSDEVYADKINAPDRDTRVLGLKQMMVHGATQLRARPIVLKILAYHLSGNSEVSQALSKSKRRMGHKYMARYENDPRYHDPELLPVRMVLYGATMYLAIRSGSDPDYNGIQLNTKAGWDRMMRMCEQVFEQCAAATKPKKTRRKKA